MKKVIIYILLVYWPALSVLAGDEVGIGQETVRPLKYPKFSLSGDYNIGKRFLGFADSGLRFNLPPRFGAALSFEAGLHKYFNAGALVGFNIPTDIVRYGEPLHYRLSLFAKPYFSLSDRIGFFARVGGGISASSGSMNGWLARFPDAKTKLQSVYRGAHYSFSSFGGNAFATLGLEFFPVSRVGLALEAGIRADIFYAKKEEYRGFSDEGTKPSGPSWLSYLLYEFPLGLTLHIIL